MKRSPKYSKYIFKRWHTNKICKNANHYTIHALIGYWVTHLHVKQHIQGLSVGGQCKAFNTYMDSRRAGFNEAPGNNFSLNLYVHL